MKITEIKTIRLRAAIPQAGQVFSRSGVRNYRSTTLVQIDTDEQLSGLGSCSGNGELIEFIIAKIISPLIVGMDPTRVVALSGIDLALWDIMGKIHGQPLYQILGGKCRDKVPVYATALYPENPAIVAKRARGFADQGFRGVKIKVGFDLDQDIETVRAVRQELDSDFTVMTDANQGYTVDVGLKAAEAFAESGVFWLEEPLFAEDIAGHAQLRKETRVPIAVGENLHMCSAFESFVMRQAVDFLQPDVARAGGITEIKKIAALAAHHHVPISFHTWGDAVALAASIHLSAIIPECTVMELDCTYNPLRTQLLRQPLEVEKGFMIPPDKPGLGIELDTDALGRFAYSGVEELAVRQKTLSAK
jgi:D-galactarolactone cycloisomerase